MGNACSLGGEFGADLLPREIRIGSVIIVDGTYPRLAVDNERVGLFRELFRCSDNRIPPIKVIPIIDCEGQYIFIDGRHRLLGKQFHSNYIQALISHNIAFTTREIETGEARRQIRFMASFYNSKHGLLFTKKELKTNIIELYRMRTPLKELYMLAPERTVRRYLKGEHEKERVEKEAREEEVIELRKSGYTQGKIARKLGLTQSAVSKIESKAAKKVKWKDNIREYGLSAGDYTGNANELFPAANRPQGILKSCAHEEKSNSGDKRDSAVIAEPFNHAQDSLAVMESVYDVMRKMKSSKKLGQHVKQYLIPLLAERFPVVNELVKGAGYVAENELLKNENQDLIKQIAGMDGKTRELQKEKEKLQSELTARTNHCRRQCRFSREQYLREQKNFLDSLLEDVEELEIYACVMKTMYKDISRQNGPRATLKQLSDLSKILNGNHRRKEYTRYLKNFIENTDNQELYSHVKAKDTDVGQDNQQLASLIINTGKTILIKTAASAAYKFLSTLDYCMQLRHKREDLSKRLARFISLIRDSDIYTRDLEERTEECRRMLDNYVEEDTNERVNQGGK